MHKLVTNIWNIITLDFKLEFRPQTSPVAIKYLLIINHYLLATWVTYIHPHYTIRVYRATVQYFFFMHILFNNLILTDKIIYYFNHSSIIFIIVLLVICYYIIGCSTQ